MGRVRPVPPKMPSLLPMLTPMIVLFGSRQVLDFEDPATVEMCRITYYIINVAIIISIICIMIPKLMRYMIRYVSPKNQRTFLRNRVRMYFWQSRRCEQLCEQRHCQQDEEND